MSRFSFRIAAFVAAAALLAACGRNVNPMPAAPSAAGLTAPALFVAALPPPAAGKTSVTIRPSGSKTVTRAFPVTGGILATVSVPKLSGGSGAITATFATGSAASLKAAALPGGPFLAELDFVANHNMTLAGSPGFTLDLTQYVKSHGMSAAQGASYFRSRGIYAEIGDGTNVAVLGPLNVGAGNGALTIAFAAPPVSLTLKQGRHDTMGLHVGKMTSSSLTLSPASLSLTGTGTANARQFTISGGTPPYSVNGFKTSLVGVKKSASSASRFIVTPKAAGTTTVVVHDGNGKSKSLPVTVTTLGGVIQ